MVYFTQITFGYSVIKNYGFLTNTRGRTRTYAALYSNINRTYVKTVRKIIYA